MVKAIKIRDEKCGICFQKFTEKDRKKENYVLTGTTFHCKENSRIENHFSHKTCQEKLKKEKTDEAKVQIK